MLRDVFCLLTGDDQLPIRRRVDIVVRDGVITEIGTPAVDSFSGELIDARRLLVMPGLVNVHTHAVQVLARATLPTQAADFTAWQRALLPVWRELDAESVESAAAAAYAELVLSGCTTIVDHHSYFPHDVTADVLFAAARRIGVRIVVARGGRSRPREDVADPLLESDERIHDDWTRLIGAFHDPSPGSMSRVVLAPTSILTASRDLLLEARRLADHRGVGVHLHLGETKSEVHHSLRRVGKRPLAYAVELGLAAPDAWIAHAIHLTGDELCLLSESGMGVAHCPSSNMRLGTGVARVTEMLRLGIRVGLGTDGAASNEAQSLTAEARMCLLLQSVHVRPGAITTDCALALATRGGAALLRRPELGIIAVGQRADLIGFDLDRLSLTGFESDPAAVVPMGLPGTVDLSVIEGRPIVVEGRLRSADSHVLIADVRRSAARVIDRAEAASGIAYRRRT